MPELKSKALADRLGVSDSAIRDWATRYKKYLSVSGKGYEKGSTRLFLYEDQIIMATIASLRDQGLSHTRIEEQLASGWRVTSVPGEDMPESEQMGLVSIGQLNRALDEVARLRLQLQETESERDSERQAKEEKEQEIADLQYKLGKAEGQAEILKQQLDAEQKRGRWGLFGNR